MNNKSNDEKLSADALALRRIMMKSGKQALIAAVAFLIGTALLSILVQNFDTIMQASKHTIATVAIWFSTAMSAAGFVSLGLVAVLAALYARLIDVACHQAKIAIPSPIKIVYLVSATTAMISLLGAHGATSFSTSSIFLKTGMIVIWIFIIVNVVAWLSSKEDRATCYAAK